MSILNNLQDLIRTKNWKELEKEPFSVFELFVTMDTSSLVWNKEFIFDYILNADYFNSEINKASGSLTGKVKTIIGALIIVQCNLLNFMKEDWKTLHEKINKMGYSISSNMKRQLKNPSLNNIEFYRLCLDFNEFEKIYQGMSTWELPNGFTFPSAEMLQQFSEKEKEQFRINLVPYSQKHPIGWRKGRQKDFYLLFDSDINALNWLYYNLMVPNYNDKFKFNGSEKTLLQEVNPGTYEKFFWEKVKSPDFKDDNIWHLMKYYTDNDVNISDDFITKVLDWGKENITLSAPQKLLKWIHIPLVHNMSKEQIDTFAERIGGSVVFKSKKLSLDEKVDICDKHDIAPWDTNIIRDNVFYTEEEMLRHPQYFPVNGLKYQKHLFISPDGYKELKQLQKVGRGGPRYKPEWTDFNSITSQLLSYNELNAKVYRYLAKKTGASTEDIIKSIQSFKPDYLPDESMKTINVFFNRYKMGV